MSARYFTSDLHLGQEAVIRFSGRPYASALEHSRGLRTLWHEQVTRGDEVYVLGDFTKGSDDVLADLAGWHGRVRLVPGNHDPSHPMRKDHARARARLEGVRIKVLEPQVWLTIAGQKVLLCHFPPEGDSYADEARFQDWRPDAGPWILHGHVHTSWRQRGRWINVGVDAWAGRPVPEDVIAELVAEGPRDRERLDWV